MPDDAAKERVKSTVEGKKAFGPLWPGATNRDGAKWSEWAKDRIAAQEDVMRDKRLHWARHRHFRQGRQWISSRDSRTWREVDGDRNHVRLVLNVIGPAMNFRLGLITEQAPGFRTQPLGTGTTGRETAEAQQRIAEYYYNLLRGYKLMRDACSHAQTDGVCFLHVFVDPIGGPSREDVMMIPPEDKRFETLQAMGYEVDEATGSLVVPLDEVGEPDIPESVVSRDIRLGDVATRVVLAHEVFFDPEAKTVNGPYDRAKWCIIRRVRDLESARLETGRSDLESEGAGVELDPIMDASVDGGLGAITASTSGYFQRGLPLFPMARNRSVRQESVYEYLIYIPPLPAAGVQRGLYLRVVGDHVVKHSDELPGGKVPLARFTDGSSDPEMYPRPDVMDCIGDQILVNTLASRLVEHVRSFGAGRLMTQKGTLISETYSNIIGSVVEYTGMKPDVVPSGPAGNDTWNLLEFFIKKLEDKLGYNDFARGQMTGSGSFSDVSGRALLGARELYERQFGPFIRAAAEGMSEWACLVVDYARWLYDEDEARLIPIAGRGDLAKRITSKDLGERSVVYVDPTTLSPLPRALRHQMLFDLLEKGMITQEEYKRQAPFAEIRDVYMGGSEQWGRAQAVNTLLEEAWERLGGLDATRRFDPEQGGIAVMWQDDPRVHKEALLELGLDERKPLTLRDLALERWGLYDQLERAKTVNPQTGQPLSPPNPLIRNIPSDMQAPVAPPAPTPTGQNAAGAPANPAPEIAPVASGAEQAAAGGIPPELGAMGDLERQALEIEQQ